jgi:hypothetical protein
MPSEGFADGQIGKRLSPGEKCQRDSLVVQQTIGSFLSPPEIAWVRTASSVRDSVDGPLATPRTLEAVRTQAPFIDSGSQLMMILIEN